MLLEDLLKDAFYRQAGPLPEVRSAEFNFGMTFSYFQQLARQGHRAKFSVFEYLGLSFGHLEALPEGARVADEYSAWTDLLVKDAETLLDLDEQQSLGLVKRLPPQMVYRFIEHLSTIYSKVKLELLQHLEALGKSDLIQNKILFFELVCKFRPQHAHRFVETLDAKHFPSCFRIAVEEQNLHAQAYIHYKSGRYPQAFDVYASM